MRWFQFLRRVSIDARLLPQSVSWSFTSESLDLSLETAKFTWILIGGLPPLISKKFSLVIICPAPWPCSACFMIRIFWNHFPWETTLTMSIISTMHLKLRSCRAIRPSMRLTQFHCTSSVLPTAWHFFRFTRVCPVLFEFEITTFLFAEYTTSLN